jgi:hypothetical protein
MHGFVNVKIDSHSGMMVPKLMAVTDLAFSLCFLLPSVLSVLIYFPVLHSPYPMRSEARCPHTAPIRCKPKDTEAT